MHLTEFLLEQAGYNLSAWTPKGLQLLFNMEVGEGWELLPAKHTIMSGDGRATYNGVDTYVWGPDSGVPGMEIIDTFPCRRRTNSLGVIKAQVHLVSVPVRTEGDRLVDFFFPKNKSFH